MIPNPWVILGAVIFLAVACAASFHAGDVYRGNADKAAQVEAMQQAEKDKALLEAELSAIVDSNATKMADLQAQVEKARANVRVVKVEIIKEVPRYVTKNADANCTIPVGFVELHDAALRNSVPNAAPGSAGASGESMDRPSGVALSEATSAVTENYGTAHEWEAEARGLRLYAEGLEKFYEDLRRTVHVCK